MAETELEKKNVPNINNPFFNIKKNEDVKRINGILSLEEQEKKNDFIKSDNIEESKEKRNKRRGSFKYNKSMVSSVGNMDSDISIDSDGSYEDSENDDEEKTRYVKDKNNYDKKNNKTNENSRNHKNSKCDTSDSSSNNRRNTLLKNNMENKKQRKRVLSTYSSSESDIENEDDEKEEEEKEEKEEEDENYRKSKSSIKKEQKKEKEKEKEKEEIKEKYTRSIKNKDTGSWEEREKKHIKIFANVEDETEKLVFLPRKIREENRKRIKKEMKINEQREDNKKMSRDSTREQSDGSGNKRKERDREREKEREKDKEKEREKDKEKERDRDREKEKEKERERERDKEIEKEREREEERKRNRNKRRRNSYEKKTKEDRIEKKDEHNTKEKTEEKSVHSDEYKMNIKSESSLAELNMLNVNKLETDNYTYKETELEIIKQQYLGLNKTKKKVQKPSEKFRNIFNFEWDPSEDTSRNDNNPLYKNRIEPQLLFGRGYIAGIDLREQRKKNNFYDKLVQNRLNLALREKQFMEGERDSEKETEKNKEDIDRHEEQDSNINVKKQNTDKMENKEGVSVKDISNVISYSAIRHATISKNQLNEYIYEPKIDNIIKDVYQKHWSEKKREEMNDRDWRIFREDNEIYIKGGIVPPPIRSWEESNLSPELLKAIKKSKYDKPTPIQMQAIPIALEMRDLIGIAETGSGKTAAFVLPMLSYVKMLPPLTFETSQDGPYALVIAPSRELAIQIYEETNKFASFCSCRTVAVVGGRNAESQAFELRKGVEIIIGTPGRIQDCLEKRYTVLNQCNYVILDEADRMMDMGFEETVHFILDKIPTTNLKSEEDTLALKEEMMSKSGHRLHRITQMFSATMPPSVERLSRKYLRAPAYISIGDPGAGKRSIEQKLEFITEGKKKQKLQEVLETYEPPIIVFVNQKKAADIIAKTITKMKFRAVSLHGGKAQEMREQTLMAFKNGDFDILVATDVAGRGIDVHGVKLVINFDMPKDIESYTHRIGRTGRAGMKGLAISFVTEFDSHLFYDLKQLLISSNNLVPMELANHPASKVKPGSIIQTPKKKQILYKN